MREAIVVSVPVSAPDVLFVGGAVFDGSASRPTHSAVAVTGAQVTAVGGAELRDLAGSHTRIVELDGALVMPGFIDSHIHPIEGGLDQMRCDLSEVSNAAEYLAAIAEYAAANPDVPWILGGGWQAAAFPGGTPLATELDRVVSDRPVSLANRDHHGTWVNSRALEMAGLRADTPDPVDGRIERDAHGAPSGTLHEGARELVARLIPRDTDDENYRALIGAQDYLLSFGATGWQDAIVGNYGGHTDTAGTYLRAAESGVLKARVVAALWWDRTRGLEQLPELIERRSQANHPKFRATTVKIMQDGIPENRTAAMIDPYLENGCRCGVAERGISFIEPTALRDYTTALDAAGFQVHLHAIGDRAVREGLDAFSAARERNGPSDNRHHIAHIQIVHPDDIERFAALNVTVNMQALWATYDPQMVELNVPILGAERVNWQYPFADLWGSGAGFCAGSDWPVTTPDPWAALHVAVNRTLAKSSADYNPVPLNARQAISFEQGLAAYTSGSARINRFEPAGRLTPGSAADIVVTDRNPFAFAPDEIAATRTMATWIAGEEVYVR